MADTFEPNLRIVSRPKVGTCAKLFKGLSRGLGAWGRCAVQLLPSVQLLNTGAASCDKDTYEVSKGCLPYTQFKLVHQIRDKHVIYVECDVCQACREGTLDQCS